MASTSRALTSAERSAAQGTTRRSFLRLRVTNPDGTWLDLGALTVNGTPPKNFINSAQLAKNIDENTLSMSAVVRREIGSLSLAPLKTDSPLNARADFTYAPTLDIRRLWAIDVAVLPGDGVPGYRPLAEGVITTLDISGEPPEAKTPGTITLSGRGMETPLLALQMLTAQDYVGAAIATRLQAMLDRWNAGVAVYPDPATAPSYFVNAGTQDVGPMMDAVQQIAGLPGAVLRYMYDAADVNRFMLFTPNRTPSAPDYVFGPSEYRSIPVTRLDLDPVRNYIELTYPDAVAGPQTITSPTPEPTTVTAVAGAATFSASPGATLADGAVIVVDGVAYDVSAYNAGAGTATLSGAPTFSGKAWITSASITRYGLRPFVIGIEKATTLGISDVTAAGGMIDAMRSDLEFPALEQQIETEGAWFPELYDYVELAPNGTHNTEPQFMGVTSVTYTFAGGKLLVTIGGRGKPSGGYRSWLALGGAGLPRAPFVPAILSANGTFVEWSAPMTPNTFGIQVLADPNTFARSAKWELSETADFAVVLQTNYSNFIDPPDPSAGAQGEFFSVADAGRLKTYYIRITPYSGHLAGWPGTAAPPPSGVAGTPFYVVVGTDALRPTKPQFDTLVGDVTTIDADLTALSNEPITVHTPTLGLPNSRAWVDSATTTIDRSTAGAISVDVTGVAEIAAAVNEIGIPIWFYQSPLASAQWLSMATIPSAAEEMGTEYRRQHYLVGAGRGRWHAIVKAVTGTPTLKLKSSTDAFATSADVDSLSITGAGYLLGAWVALPSSAEDDVRVSPFLLDGAGTASVDFYALWYEVLPDLVTAFRDFSDDFSDDFS